MTTGTAGKRRAQLDYAPRELTTIGRYCVAEGGAIEVRYAQDWRKGQSAGTGPQVPFPVWYLEVSKGRGGPATVLELPEPLQEDTLTALSEELRWLDTPGAPPETEEVHQAVADALAALGEQAEIEAEDTRAAPYSLHHSNGSVLDDLIVAEELGRMEASWLAPLVR